MLDNLMCPISDVRINRNVVRLNGLITTILLVAYVVTGSPWIIVPLGLDYVFRAMMNGPTSPMTRLAQELARVLKLPNRVMDRAPKVFASRIGVCFAMGAAIAHFVAPQVALYAAGTLAVFTALESLLDFCVGCVVYTFVVLPLYRARDAVKRISLLREVSDPVLLELAGSFDRVELPADQQIITEGEVGDAMYVPVSGKVEVYRDGEDGQRSVVNSHEARAHFGEMALLNGDPRNAHVRATTPVTALKLGLQPLGPGELGDVGGGVVEPGRG